MLSVGGLNYSLTTS